MVRVGVTFNVLNLPPEQWSQELSANVLHSKVDVTFCYETNVTTFVLIRKLEAFSVFVNII